MLILKKIELFCYNKHLKKTASLIAMVVVLFNSALGNLALAECKNVCNLRPLATMEGRRKLALDTRTSLTKEDMPNWNFNLLNKKEWENLRYRLELIVSGTIVGFAELEDDLKFECGGSVSTPISPQTAINILCGQINQPLARRPDKPFLPDYSLSVRDASEILQEIFKKVNDRIAREKLAIEQQLQRKRVHDSMIAFLEEEEVDDLRWTQQGSSVNWQDIAKKLILAFDISIPSEDLANYLEEHSNGITLSAIGEVIVNGMEPNLLGEIVDKMRTNIAYITSTLDQEFKRAKFGIEEGATIRRNLEASI